MTFICAYSQILPALVNFNPDMIFVSAGFDAHRKASQPVRVERNSSPVAPAQACPILPTPESTHDT
eukprot:1159402-Pelagomonas_calceolata.AAC.7